MKEFKIKKRGAKRSMATKLIQLAPLIITGSDAQ